MYIMHSVRSISSLHITTTTIIIIIIIIIRRRRRRRRRRRNRRIQNGLKHKIHKTLFTEKNCSRKKTKTTLYILY